MVGSDMDYHGSSGYLKKMEALVRDLGLERVRFLGEKIGAEKVELFKNADIYILPSYTENFGITVGEALLCGTPVITTDQTPWGIIEREGCGWITSCDISNLTNTIFDACSLSQNQLFEMGLLGRKMISEKLNWHNVATEMLVNYRRILE